MISKALLLFFYLPCIIAVLTPIDDPNSLPKYSLNFVAPLTFKQVITNNDTRLSNGKIIQLGPHTQCYLPDVISQPKEVNQTELQMELERELTESIDIISSELSNRCLSFMGGFWTYQFCYGKNLTQYNKPLEGKSLDFVLSRFDEDRDVENTQLLFNEFGYYISDMVDSGDICDQTGYPRKVEFQYVCDLSIDAVRINWIKEVRLCQYQAQISVPKLCNFHLLAQIEKETTFNLITCTREHQEVKFDSVLAVENYDFYFAGNAFYLLQPSFVDLGNSYGISNNMTVLLYMDDLVISPDELSIDKTKTTFLQRIMIAFHKMLAQKKITSPNGKPYEFGDQFIWLSKVIDYKGNVLCVVKVSMDGKAQAAFEFDSIGAIDDLTDSNFVSYVWSSSGKSTSQDLFPEHHGAPRRLQVIRKETFKEREYEIESKSSLLPDDDSKSSSTLTTTRVQETQSRSYVGDSSSALDRTQVSISNYADTYRRDVEMGEEQADPSVVHDEL